MKNLFLILVLALAVCTTTVSASCSKRCTFDYSPVCGEDKDGNKHTYANKCTLEVAACEEASKGIRYLSDGKC